MKAYHQEFSIEIMGAVLRISRCGYYHFLKAEPSLQDPENRRLLEKTIVVHTMSFETYESPGIHADFDVNREVPSCKRSS